MASHWDDAALAASRNLILEAVDSPDKQYDCQAYGWYQREGSSAAFGVLDPIHRPRRRDGLRTSGNDEGDEHGAA
ncbi:hypothetical protein AB0C86_37410 [Streptomyces lavendulae]|uniref:hypothetical protein n=1 Tax=Streptomyces lavendulae TaxID=1914 RepID=UPI0033FD366B